MRAMWRRIRSDRRGNGDVAAIIVVVPLALGLVLVWVFFGRQGVAAEGVTHAAAVAARAASQQRSAGDATGAAHAAAAATLAEEGTACSGGPSVAVSASEWAPGGVVTVTVTCQVDGIADLGAGPRSVSSTAYSSIDFHREYDR